MSMDISGVTSMLYQNTTNATNNASQSKVDGLKNTVNGLSSESTEEELMEVLKDFESYFVEQMIKKMKETFTDDEEESSVASQYTDTFMDYAIEDIADQIVDDIGGNMTQQLFEQMKRNYNIPTVEEVEKAAENVAGTNAVEEI